MALFPSPTRYVFVPADLLRSDVVPPWFDDGNLIIAIDDMSFRVHASVIVRLSPQFADLWQNRPNKHAVLHTVYICNEDPVDFAILFSALYYVHPYVASESLSFSSEFFQTVPVSRTA
ncbi:hypothetical protein C0992_005920 [Termitomyces sp. T32_za158]|nr:hypothetical protein C0992_005920 [Termitomyces sp. T32_za158]